MKPLCEHCEPCLQSTPSVAGRTSLVLLSAAIPALAIFITIFLIAQSETESTLGRMMGNSPLQDTYEYLVNPKTLAVVSLVVILLSFTYDELRLQRYGKRIATRFPVLSTPRDTLLAETLQLAYLRQRKFVNAVGFALGLVLGLVLTVIPSWFIVVILTVSLVAFTAAREIEKRHHSAAIALRDYRRGLRDESPTSWSRLFRLQRRLRIWQSFKTINVAVFSLILLFVLALVFSPNTAVGGAVDASGGALLFIISLAFLLLARMVYVSYKSLIELKSRHLRLHDLSNIHRDVVDLQDLV